MMAQSDREKRPSDMDNVKTNRALHAMTAHCLRYATELSSIIAVISELQYQHRQCQQTLKIRESDRIQRALRQKLAEARSIARAQTELSKKIKNTLALVSFPPILSGAYSLTADGKVVPFGPSRTR